VIYLYAVVERRAGPPAAAGLEDAPLEALRLDRLAVICSRHAEKVFAPQAEALWRHDRVVEEAMRGGPALPVRFGTTFDEERRALAALAAQAPRLARRLHEVRGCVELAVRVEPSSPWPTVAARTGIGYLGAKLERRRAARSLAEQALSPLDALAVASRRLAPSAAGLRASYLVPSARVERFADAVRGLCDRGLRVSCTGPWPPYSFVEDEV